MDDGFENARIENEHRAGNAREADRHHHEKLGPRQPFEIGTDQERALDHPDEHGGGGGEPHRAAEPHAPLQQERKAPRHPAEHAPVPEQRRKRRHDEDERQRLEAEHEGARGILDLEGRGPAADIAEDEARAGARRRRQRIDRIVEREKAGLRDGDFEKQKRNRDLERDSDGNLPQRKSRPFFADEPGKADEDAKAQGALQGMEGHRGSGRRGGGSGSS